MHPDGVRSGYVLLFRHGLTSQRLLKDLERVVEFGFVLSALGDSPYRVQNRGVIAAAEKLADFGQGFLG
jgi:hypothetical protein